MPLYLSVNQSIGETEKRVAERISAMDPEERETHLALEVELKELVRGDLVKFDGRTYYVSVDVRGGNSS